MGSHYVPTSGKMEGSAKDCGVLTGTGESVGRRKPCSLLCPVSFPHQPHADCDQDTTDEGVLGLLSMYQIVKVSNG